MAKKYKVTHNYYKVGAVSGTVDLDTTQNLVHVQYILYQRSLSYDNVDFFKSSDVTRGL